MPLPRLLVFVLVVGGMTALLHGYLWFRLVRSPGWPAPWQTAGAAALVVLGLTIVAALACSRALPRAVATPLVRSSHVWLGVMFYLVFLTLAAEPVALLLGRTAATWRALAAGVAVAAGVVCALGLREAARAPAVVRVEVAVPGLDPRLRGFRIVQLSDLHFEFASDRAFAERVAAIVAPLDADLVAVTGDLVDGTVRHLADAVEPLRGLRARHGVFFVTGNHDFYSGADAWCAHLARLGWRVLRNEHSTVVHDGASLDVAGIDDPTGASLGRPPDLAAALAGRDPSRPVVLLAHQPSAVLEAASRGVDLQLSGHTHGGQLAPFGWFVRLAQPAVAGLSRHGGTALYVSRGTGFWGPPMRVGAPAEVTILTLVPAS